MLFGFQFQFTPLREGRRTRIIENEEAEVFQFTPLREGRQVVEFRKRRKVIVSIHAPA